MASPSTSYTASVLSLFVLVLFYLILGLRLAWRCWKQRQRKQKTDAFPETAAERIMVDSAAARALASRRTHPRRVPLEAVRRFLGDLPDAYDQAVANGQADQVAWMRECGLVSSDAV